MFFFFLNSTLFSDFWFPSQEVLIFYPMKICLRVGRGTSTYFEVCIYCNIYRLHFKFRKYGNFWMYIYFIFKNMEIPINVIYRVRNIRYHTNFYSSSFIVTNSNAKVAFKLSRILETASMHSTSLHYGFCPPSQLWNSQVAPSKY